MNILQLLKNLLKNIEEQMKVFYYENKEYIKTDKAIFLAWPLEIMNPKFDEMRLWIFKYFCIWGELTM